MMRRPSLSIIATVTAMTLLLGCETDRRETVVEADQTAIKTVIVELTDAYADCDWDAFAGFFTDDGIWMPPGLTPLSGKDAWWSFAQQWWDISQVVDIGVTTEELVVIGDWAIESHTEFQVTTFEGSEEPGSVYFKGIWIFRRQDDGSWKIAQYIWNENTPPG